VLDLRRITLVSIITRDYDANRILLADCLVKAAFANVIVFTDRPELFSQYKCIKVSRNSHEGWCVFRMTKLFKAIKECMDDYMLFIESDAAIVAPDAWRNEWLEWDYIGAPWKDGVVGNGGFCLQSRKFLEAVESLNISPAIEACNPCDWLLGRRYRPQLEALGIKYAPLEVANKFSNETGKYLGAFGVHGSAMLEVIKHNGEGSADATGKIYMEKQKIIFYLLWYKCGDVAHQSEIDEAFRRNANNPYADRVEMVIERRDIQYAQSIKNDFPKVRIRSCQLQPTFSDIFAFALGEAAGTICVVLNGDCYIDETLKELRTMDIDQKFLCISRHEDNGELVVSPQNSQDGWCFLAQEGLRRIAAPYLFGYVGCDNAIAFFMQKRGYELLNPCHRIIVHHLHKDKQRHYLGSVPRPWAWVWPEENGKSKIELVR